MSRLLAAVAVSGLVVIFVGGLVRADEVRYYEENGITYRETRRVEKRPVSKTQYEDRSEPSIGPASCMRRGAAIAPITRPSRSTNCGRT